MDRYMWEEQSGAGEVGDPFAWCLWHSGCSFPMSLGQGRMFHVHGDQYPQPNLTQKSRGIKEWTREHGHKPQLLRKPVSGKNPLDLTCSSVVSPPIHIPAPKGWSRHHAGTTEGTSQLCNMLGIARSCYGSLFVTKLISGPVALG